MRTAKEIGDFCISNKYDFSGGTKIYQHFEIIERNLKEDEDVIFAFVSNGVTDRNGRAILGGLMAVTFTNKKIIYAQRRSIMGDYVKTVNYENINDISSKIGWVFGEIVIDSITEYMDFTIDKEGVEDVRNKVSELIEDYRNKKNSLNSQNTYVSTADEIKKFKELLDMGIITQEEFDKKKKELLNL